MLHKKESENMSSSVKSKLIHRKNFSEGGSALPHRPKLNVQRHYETSKKRVPLILYICRVPGNNDVFLTTSKPSGATVSAVDVLTSSYYIHVDHDHDQSHAHSNATSLKLLRRMKGQEPYKVVADLTVPTDTTNENTLVHEDASLSVDLVSDNPSGTVPNQQNQSVYRFAITRECIDWTSSARGSKDFFFDDWDQHAHNGEYEIDGPEHRSDATSFSRLKESRNRFWKKLSKKQDLRRAFVFSNSFGTRCIMKSSTIGDSLKTYNESKNPDGSLSRLLAAELRFNLAPESASRSRISSKLKRLSTTMVKQKSMSFLREDCGQRGFDSNKSRVSSNDSSSESHDTYHFTVRTNTLPTQEMQLSQEPIQSMYVLSQNKHPRGSPLPPPPPPPPQSSAQSNLSSDFSEEVDWYSRGASKSRPYISRKPVPPPRQIKQENIKPGISGSYRSGTQMVTFHHDSDPQSVNYGFAENVEPPVLTRKVIDQDEDPLALGKQQLGGGVDGQQAKLGKILVYDSDKGMTDTLIAANIAVWYQGFFQTPFSTTAD